MDLREDSLPVRSRDRRRLPSGPLTVPITSV
jgi:hypothetical protein